ncbi:tetratricopeptide repeat protein [Allosphingosinicella deserti]|uniref:Tetratricopeptide repeat-containing protein n=1 Tax=Allosphingosinicella deserti TaxID=2116704 RepID=A0A2P7QEH6_9SPHN|nr:tetratricopeptide repeat protein [Sphingomonas deserti]PSJ36373.1 tetratricopeptide repeat-containing protein [Sphingomonas deserti]
MDHPDPVGSKRLDGWKSVATYFNRDRTTVMRWARARKLPIHRMPGGKQGSVFAFEHELAAWALRHDDVAIAADHVPQQVMLAATVAEPAKTRPAGIRAIRVPVIAAGCAALAVILAGDVAWRAGEAPAQIVERPALSLPRDPLVAADFVTARDMWARRSSRDLVSAIRLYESVIRRDPHFAPAHSGLADAWLLIREYGAVDDPTAYRRARRHAEDALRLDPRLPGAHRALGFVEYWWSGRAPSALKNFRRAIALDERDPQSHFWYANVLADLGDDQNAQREYNRARLLSPGSRTIEVEQACSHWQAGRDELALRQLSALAERAPEDATVYNCLAWLHISHGDIVQFAHAFSARARIQREVHLLRVSAEVEAAVRRDPRTAVGVLVAASRREIAAGARKSRDTPAFYASSMGERAMLVQLLTEASDLREQWYSAPVTRRIAERWRGDAEVQQLLRSLTPRQKPLIPTG